MSNGLKKKTVTLTTERDNGKTFLITEMPAIQADEWAHELFYNAATAGMNLKDVNVMNLDTKSMAGMIEIGAAIGSILGRIKPVESRRLKFELLDRCVQIVPTGGQPRMCIWEQEIEDPQNYTLLAAHVIGLHLDFLKQGETSN